MSRERHSGPAPEFENEHFSHLPVDRAALDGDGKDGRFEFESAEETLRHPKDQLIEESEPADGADPVEIRDTPAREKAGRDDVIVSYENGKMATEKNVFELQRRREAVTRLALQVFEIERQVDHEHDIDLSKENVSLDDKRLLKKPYLRAKIREHAKLAADLAAKTDDFTKFKRSINLREG